MSLGKVRAVLCDDLRLSKVRLHFVKQLSSQTHHNATPVTNVTRTREGAL